MNHLARTFHTLSNAFTQDAASEEVERDGGSLRRRGRSGDLRAQDPKAHLAGASRREARAAGEPAALSQELWAGALRRAVEKRAEKGLSHRGAAGDSTRTLPTPTCTGRARVVRLEGKRLAA